MTWLAVGIGGVVGALLRYYAGAAIGHHAAGIFPTGTLLINWIGCLVLGWFNTWGNARPGFSPILRLGFGTGLIGSFTTFSTFSVEAVILMRDHYYLPAFLYIFASLIGGILLAWSGAELAAWQIRSNGKGGPNP